ncbi:MAG: transporter family protein, partial [Rickettsiaceae bacterium]|nr:transporter family protein [Rickettsiaceae bacterium]
GFIFQRYNLLATSTAAENVAIPATYAGVEVEERKSRATNLLKRLGLGERMYHRPSELSGGQQQRVAIARALVNNPPIIFADEPTGALDSRSGEEVMALLGELHSEGRTIIIITHEESVAMHAHRLIRIQDGKITEDTVLKKDSINQEIPYHPEQHNHMSLTTSMAEALSSALRSLNVNLFRTCLTLLGIIIGVASVVTMLAVGEGSRQRVLAGISSMGTNLLTIRPGAPGIRGSGDISTLIMEDAEAIKTIPNVDNVIAERSGRFTLRYGNVDYQANVQGVSEDFPAAREWKTRRGAFFSAQDVLGFSSVAVLGKTTAQILFEGANPLGQYIIIKNTPFQVIGIMESKGASPGGADQDDTAFVPITTGAIRLFGKSYLNGITVKVADTTIIDTTQERITDLLKSRHMTEDFRIRNMASVLETATATQNTLTIMLGAVAAISLLVGGIGVMNIMLVSVTERTREIGIRMATGARMRDILLQFNIESAVVCAVGGILGVCFGIITGLILKAAGMSIVFSILPAALAFACAFATGIIFGYLPAKKAARLDPVIALASE